MIRLNNRGMTLIEIIITTTIFAIITSLASISFSKFMSRIRVNDYSEKLKTMIEEAKSNSIIKGIEGFNINYELYGVQISQNDFLLIRYNDDDSVTNPANICLNINSNQLTILDNITVDNVNILDINDDPFTGVTVIFNKRGYSCGATVGFTVKIQHAGNEKTISLNSIGGIDVN